MSSPRWYRSLYWRIAIGFILTLAAVLVVQATLFVWVLSRGGPTLPGQPERFAQTVAVDVGEALRSDPSTDLAAYIDDQYARDAHAPGSLAAQAVRRPAADRHNIAELVVHCAYWKYTVVRRLAGEARGTFALSGSNFFVREAPYSEEAWTDDIRLLDDTHRGLRAEIVALTDRQLLRLLGDSDRTTVFDTVAGIAAHDLYHAGQIQMLKRLIPAGR